MTRPIPRTINNCQPQKTATNNAFDPQNSAIDYEQLIINKLFSNPSLKSILDPAAKLFNQNGCDVSRQFPNNYSPGCNSVPNVVNNYIVLPPELFLNEARREYVRDDRKALKRRRDENPKRITEERQIKPTELRSEERQCPIKTREDRKGRQRQIERCDEFDRNEFYDDYLDDRERCMLRRRSDAKRNKGRQNIDTERNDDRYDDRIENRVSSRKRDQDGKSNIKVNKNLTGNKITTVNEGGSNQDIDEKFENILDNHEASKVQSEAKRLVQKKKSPSVSEENDNSLKLTSRNQDIIPKDTTKFNRDEAVIQEFLRKFPAIPEDVVRQLLSHLKRQLQNEKLGSNPYCPSRPINYDHLYNTHSPNRERKDRNRSNNVQRKNDRRRNRQRKKKKNENNCDTTVELSPSIYVEEPTTTQPIRTSDKSTIKSTTVPSTTQPTTRVPEEDFDYITTPKYFKDIPKNPTLVKELNPVETTTQLAKANDSKYPEDANDLYDKTSVPELGSEDTVPKIYVNKVVDDYYPDFTIDNNAYAFSNEDLFVKKLQDDRYHYTTDKNIEIKEWHSDSRNYVTEWNKANQQRNSNIQSEKMQIQANSEETEVTIPKPDFEEFSEEIEFKPPPFLEMPDFETKPINKEILKSFEGTYYNHKPTEKYTDVTDKASTYSNVKSIKLTMKDGNEKMKPKTGLETVYAISKVAKYGQTTEKSEEIISTEANVDDFSSDSLEEDFNSIENKLSVDGDTTFVIANSYPHQW